jgi:N-acetylmuramic acid 6-phosphate (MurNAc-6-P) etherase
VKTAVLMERARLDRADAEARLASSEGSLRRALEQARESD